jgi:hypothetical protein
MALMDETVDITPVLTMPNEGPVLGLPNGPWVDLTGGNSQVVFPPRYEKRINLRVAAWTQTDPQWRAGVESQLNEVVNLPEGWDSYGGHPVSIDAATAAVSVLSLLWPPDGFTPSIAPLPSGGLTLSWRIGQTVVDIDVDSSRYDAYVESDGVVVAEGDLRENLEVVKQYLAFQPNPT